MPTLFLFGASEGGLFDFDATLPLMAVQVVLLTFILNALFFKPVGRVVEEREDYVNTSRSEAKKKIVKALRFQTQRQLKNLQIQIVPSAITIRCMVRVKMVTIKP